MNVQTASSLINLYIARQLDNLEPEEALIALDNLKVYINSLETIYQHKIAEEEHV